MKILHVAKKYPNALGGDAVVVSNLVKQQEARGHQAIILTSNCDEIQDSKAIYKFGLRETSAGLDNITVKRLLSLIILLFKAFKILRKERPDVIHSQSIDMAFFVSIAARFYKVPIVHTFQILTYYDENQSCFRRRTELFLTRGANAALLTAPNQYDVAKLSEVGFGRVAVLPNGIDLDFWHGAPGDEKPRAFTFVTIGRLERQKGIRYLIEAADILRETQEQEFRIKVVGTGELRAELGALVEELGLQDVVEFCGRKSREETRSIYETSHVVVIPSLYETTPLTLLEAWAMKVPVIMTPVGMLRGLESSSVAQVVKMADKSLLAEAMGGLMNDPYRRAELVRNGSREVSALDWTAVAQSLQRLYEQVAA